MGKFLNLEGQIIFDVYNGSIQGAGRFVSSVGSTDDPEFKRSRTTELSLNAGQLTAIGAIVSTGIDDFKTEHGVTEPDPEPPTNADLGL